MCSNVAGSALTPATCMPPLCANAFLPTYGWSGPGVRLSSSSRKCEASVQPSSVGRQSWPSLSWRFGDDRGEVGVAAALAVAVHRALDEQRALGDGGERVRHAALGVVVAVDAERGVGSAPRDGAHRGGDLVGQRRAVGVAQRRRSRRPPRRPRAGTRARTRGRRASRRRSARRRRSRACPGATRNATDSAIIAQVLVAADLARPSPGAGSRSCRRACRPARTTRQHAQRRVVLGARRRAAASSRTRTRRRAGPRARAARRARPPWGSRPGSRPR